MLEQPEIKSALFDTANQGFFGQLFGGDSESKQESDKLDQLAGYKSTVRQIKVYLSTIEIKPVRRTSLVTVEATVSDPRLAALIANRHSESYIDWVRQNRIDQQARGLTFLRAQADELREKVADLERELADYAEANSIVAVNKDENITAQKMSQLNRLLTDATAKRIEAENLYKEAEAALSNPSAGFDDPSTQHMRGELAKLEAEYQQLSAKFTSSYPRMVQLKAQISGLKQSIEGQRRQVVTGLKAKMLAAQQEEKNLHEELEQQKSQAFELSKRQVQFNVLNRELTSSRELLQNVLRQIKETSLAVESNASNVSIVDYAVTPIEPSFPRKKLILLLGMIVGVGLGVGVALLFNYMDSSIRTPEDVMHLLKLPSLGVVPSFELEALGPPGSAPGAGSAAESNGASWKGSKDGGVGQAIVPLAQAVSDLPIVFVNNPRSLASEAYRTIRTGILLSQAGEPPRTMLVSSAQSAEGKTTTSINLAASLASAGGRVILVDADLRRPSVEKHLNMQRTDLGLVDVITGQRTLEEVIIPDVIKRVSVIPSGKIPPNPAELLGSRDMLEIIGQLARMYDYVLIDSPPVLPVTDSVILSRFVDGVVLVVRGATTPRKVVADAKRRLQSVGARFLGVILNDVNVSGGDYYYYNRYYYSYYTEDNQKRAKRPKQAAAG
ncbi:MAG: hypothetical protein DCC75_09525 [Proteobacteria bacterium]|nr:MAG: hypothetical protein DCC75_09525 [Pseudomonadota bacterium]